LGENLMLSFNKLGLSGRLGNQMFQYAALRGIAANRGFDWVMPPQGINSIDEYGHQNNYCLFETFKMGSVQKKNFGYLPEAQWAVWREFHFNQNLFDNCPDNI
jgi:hypothetical protein